MTTNELRQNLMGGKRLISIGTLLQAV